ncbi:MAG: 23S rRNA (pseudouridine(1915)-N(3))-methyltransferase RlmH [Thermoanaerobaculia bacterium]
MKFRLVWVGSIADNALRGLTERYMERIRHFFPLEVIEVRSERNRQKKSDAAIMRAESASLMAVLPPQGVTIVVDPRGQMVDSLKFSEWLERVTTTNPHGATFVMGGDVGMDDAIRERADRVLALSAMTLPHEIARLVLVEQIYRACTIMRNISYHK